MSIYKFLKEVLSKRMLTAIISVSILVIFGTLLLLNPKFPDINVKDMLNYNKEYTLSPIYNNDFIAPLPVKYPFVQIPPGDFRYFYVQAKEKRMLKIKKYDEVFFAEKRIAELLKWGDIFPIDFSSNDIEKTVFCANDKQTIRLLKAWRSNQNRKDKNSWETILTRYISHMENREDELIFQTENDYIDTSKEIILFATRLKTHNQDLKTRISTLKKTYEQKKYLLRLNDIIYRYLNQRIVSVIPLFSPNSILFSISNVVREKEYGIYDVIISNIPGIIDVGDKIYLKLNNSIHSPSYRDTSENEVVYKNIKIPPDKFSTLKVLSIQLPKENLAKNIIWGKQQKTDLIYYADIFNDQSYNTYYLKFKSKINSFFRLKLSKQYKTKDSNGKFVRKSDILIEQPFNTAPDKTDSFETLVQLNTSGKESSLLHVSIESSLPLFDSDLQSISVKLVPIYDALITLKRIPKLSLHKPVIKSTKFNPFTYRVNFKNSSSTEEDYAVKSLGSRWRILSDTQVHAHNETIREITFIYKPLLLLFYALVWLNLSLITFILYLRIKQMNHGFFSMRARFSNIINFINKYLFVKSILPIVALIGILVDILWLRSYSDIILVFLTLCWIGVLLMYQFDSRATFTFALMSLITSPFFSFFKNDVIAQKLGIWSFEFLLIGSVQSVIEIKYYKTLPLTVFIKKLVPLPTFINRCIRLLVKFVNIVVKICIRFSNVIGCVIKKAFCLSLTPSNLILIVLKSGILFIIILFLFLVYQKVSSFIETARKVHKEKQLRQSLNPDIKKVEPQIAYYATKVIIFGDNFDSKESKNVVLKMGKEIIKTSLWTNSKIIFTIPLDWKPGHINLSIEKKIKWKNEQITVKSATFTINLLPISTTFTANDDAYFRHLKTLEDETLKINGYNPEDYK